MTTPMPKLKWYEHIWRKRTPFHYFALDMRRKGDKLNKEERGKFRYHCTDLYDGQLLMFWVQLDGGVQAGWTCEVPSTSRSTTDPFARNGTLVMGREGPNPNRWAGFDARLSSRAITDARDIALPILKVFNKYQQDLARSQANKQTLNGKRLKPFPCDQYRLIGIPLMVRRDQEGPSSHETERRINFGQHNLKTVPRVAPTKFVERLMVDIRAGAADKASLANKMKRFHSSANPSKSGAAMTGAGYLQESHIVISDRLPITVRP